MKSNEWTAWGRDESGEARKELGGAHDAVGLLTPGFAERVRDAAVVQPAEPLEAERRARAVSTQPLSAASVVRRDNDASMDVEAARTSTPAIGPQRVGQRFVVALWAPLLAVPWNYPELTDSN